MKVSPRLYVEQRQPRTLRTKTAKTGTRRKNAADTRGQLHTDLQIEHVSKLERGRPLVCKLQRDLGNPPVRFSEGSD